MLLKRLAYWLQAILPQKILSRCLGYLANSQVRWFKNAWIKLFCRAYAINMDEAMLSNIQAYASFNDFFIRLPKPELRPIAMGADVVASPCDGYISEFGTINEGSLVQAKGISYSLHELLTQDDTLVQQFKKGSFITIYLAPHNFHRVHMPLLATLRKMIYAPGKLFSVNRTTAAVRPRLFSRNERVVCSFAADNTQFAVVMVGALLVGSIYIDWAGTLTPPHGQRRQEWNYENNSQQHIQLERGAEMGYFRFGSTVILLCEHEIQWAEALQPGATVKLGQSLGKLKI